MTHGGILYPKRNEASIRRIPLAQPCFYANIPYLTFAYRTFIQCFSNVCTTFTDPDLPPH